MTRNIELGQSVFVVDDEPRVCEAIRETLDRFRWEAHGSRAEFADDFSGFVVDYESDEDHRRTRQFDGHLNDVIEACG